MSSVLKSDVISLAYSKGRISGLTAQPVAEEVALALIELEGMATQFARKNICTLYNFEDSPSTSSPSGLAQDELIAYASNLAVRLLVHFGKVPLPDLKAEQSSGYSYLSSVTAQVNPIQPPRRQPIGSGNSRVYQEWNRYYTPQAEAPISCATNKMAFGDVQDYVEHFDTYLLAPETVASYTLEAETGLTVVTESLASPDVNYRIRADGTNNETDSNVLQVKIVATTSDGRVTTRLVTFELRKVEV